MTGENYFDSIVLRRDDELGNKTGARPLARERLDAAAAVRDIRVMSGCARIVATTTSIPFGGMSGGRAR